MLAQQYGIADDASAPAGAVHVVMIASLVTRESMDGWPIDRFYSSRGLQESDKKWLKYLKKAAEP
jgi:hypothetical protein